MREMLMKLFVNFGGMSIATCCVAFFFEPEIPKELMEENIL